MLKCNFYIFVLGVNTSVTIDLTLDEEQELS